jgi:hypothetical protein
MSAPNQTATPHAGIARMAIESARQFLSLTRHRWLRRPSDRLGQAFRVDDGRSYQIFRETVSDAAPSETATVLVVGFQLKVIRAYRLPHWLFQRCCLLTTPFWSGLPGFSVKLWMVDPETKRYLGIYDWRGLANTQAYVDALTRVLRPLSTADSVWYRLEPDRALDAYLAEHAAGLAPERFPRRPATGAVPVRESIR